MSNFAADCLFHFSGNVIITSSSEIYLNKGGKVMEDANRAKQLEMENQELKKEVEVLFQTVVQLKESLNLLVNRYVVNESNLEK